MSKYKIVDTNILLNYPHILEEPDLIISTDVLKELDGLKLNSNSEVAFQARRAAVLISKKLNELQFDSSLDEAPMKVDDKLIELTKSYAGELITNDVYLKLKAHANNIRTNGYGGNEDYIGVKYWKVDLEDNKDREDLENIFENQIIPDRFSLKENEFFIAIDEEKNVLGMFCNRDEKLENITPKAIKNKWINKITPRNPEQVCLVNALYSPATILYAGGPQGAGKSYLLNNYALSQLEKGEIRKIVYIPNNAYVKDSMELGYLPGNSIEKATPLIGPLVDLIGMDEVNRMLSNEQLEVVPLAYLRGRNFDDAIIIVNEAQNLSPNHIKLLIGRVGNNSRIFLDGSLQQIDSDLFKNKNGLRSLLKLADSPYASNFITIRLRKVERSKTAQIADYLDEVGGF